MNRSQIALVTGATGGIGEAAAHRLQARNYEVIATGRNPQALRSLRSQGLLARHLDVTDHDAVAELTAEITTDYGGVDVLVNCAGFGFASPLEQAALADIRNLFEANVFGMLHLCQAVLPAMRERGFGTIVNIGSTGGRFTTPGAGPYHMTKYSVEALSLALRAEVKRFGIRVVLLEPTGVRTNFSQAQLRARRPVGAPDPYGEFKRRYDEATHALAAAPLVTIDADTVARAVVKAVVSRNPKPRYIVGASGKASILARRLLTDRMWDRLLLERLVPEN